MGCETSIWTMTERKKNKYQSRGGQTTSRPAPRKEKGGFPLAPEEGKRGKTSLPELSMGKMRSSKKTALNTFSTLPGKGEKKKKSHPFVRREKKETRTVS